MYKAMIKSTPPERVAAELQDLIATGEKLIATASSAQGGVKGTELVEVMAWASRAGHTVTMVSGENGVHSQICRRALEYEGFTNIYPGNYKHLCEIQGALRAVQHDLEGGLLFDIRKLVQADIFADFLQMAEYLLNEGYKDASAVLIGGVLEDSLRKLSDSKGLPLVSSNGRTLTIDPLNAGLAKAGVYPPLTQKQITTWANLRNDAAHGNYVKYSAEDVRQMLIFVQRFCGDYLQ